MRGLMRSTDAFRYALIAYINSSDVPMRESVRVVKNENLPMKLAIYIYTLDPRMNKNTIEKT
jgi:hypothetical protein